MDAARSTHSDDRLARALRRVRASCSESQQDVEDAVPTEWKRLKDAQTRYADDPSEDHRTDYAAAAEALASAVTDASRPDYRLLKRLDKASAGASGAFMRLLETGVPLLALTDGVNFALRSPPAARRVPLTRRCGALATQCDQIAQQLRDLWLAAAVEGISIDTITLEAQALEAARQLHLLAPALSRQRWSRFGGALALVELVESMTGEPQYPDVAATLGLDAAQLASERYRAKRRPRYEADLLSNVALLPRSVLSKAGTAGAT